jgi:hypothetical protein
MNFFHPLLLVRDAPAADTPCPTWVHNLLEMKLFHKVSAGNGYTSSLQQGIGNVNITRVNAWALYHAIRE